MDKELTKKLRDAIEMARLERSIHGPFTNEEVAADIQRNYPDLFAEVQGPLALHAIAGLVGSATRRAIAVSEPEQRWLPLTEFEHIPQFIQTGQAWLDLQNATLEQYRECTTAFKAKLESYGYARQSQAKAKRDKKVLREMKDLGRTLAPYFAGHPEMTMGKAAELHEQYLSKPSVLARIKGGKAKAARTKNQ